MNMKKSIFGLAAMAVAVSMASCSLDEVMEQPAEQAIGFTPFVGKATKAATELVTPGLQGTALSEFYVFGKYGTTQGGTYTTDVFSNVKVEVTAANTAVSTEKYWIANKYYKFAAYSNGNTQLATTSAVSFDESGHIKFTDYEAGTNDLILADPDEVPTGATLSSTYPSAVALTFSHLLSQVAFEFKNGFTNGYKVKITNLKFSVNNKATYSYQSNAYSWGTATDSKEKLYTVNESKEFDNSAAKTSEYNFIIPQSNENITASFKVEVIDDKNNSVATKEYNATNSNAVSLATGTTTTPNASNTWVAGYKYKYTATIDANVLDDVMFPIKFTVTSVGAWQDGSTPTGGLDLDGDDSSN